MKNDKGTKPAAPPADAAPRQLRPVGTPRRFKKDEYYELKDGFATLAQANTSVQQTIEIAKAAVDMARQVQTLAEQRLNKLRERYSLPDGIYAHDNDKCTFQRLE